MRYERLTQNASGDILSARRERLSQRMVLVLPGFGRWASAMRDFETPYGKAGIRQLEVLYVLRHDYLDRSVPTATAIAEFFQIQRSVLTKILAKLEAGGLVTREPDPADGRAWRIEITEKGKRLSDYVERQFFQEMREALGEIGEKTSPLWNVRSISCSASRSTLASTQLRGGPTQSLANRARIQSDDKSTAPPLGIIPCARS